VNTAKKLSTFLSEVRAQALRLEMSADAAEVWQKAWLSRQVPGFASAHVLWSSGLGLALRYSRVLSKVPVEREEDEGEEETVLDGKEFPDFLERYSRQGVFDSYDTWLLRELNGKKKLSQLAKSPRTLFKFGRRQIPDSYIEELLERVRRHRL
jgi:hypothetical protein